MKTIDFPDYKDVENPAQRYWNIVNTYFNIKALMGQESAAAYIKQFTKPDLFAIYTIMNRIVVNGFEATRRQLFKELNYGS